MLSILGSTRIYVCQAATDMRCSFEGLSYRAREVVKEDPQSGHLFLFLNKTRDKLKILYFDHSGYAIWYKELQRGTFSCPEKRELTSGELGCLLEGIEIAGIRRKKRYSGRITTAQSVAL